LWKCKPFILELREPFLCSVHKRRKNVLKDHLDSGQWNECFFYDLIKKIYILLWKRRDSLARKKRNKILTREKTTEKNRKRKKECKHEGQKHNTERRKRRKKEGRSNEEDNNKQGK
jgi:hypothetical protein